MAYLVMSSDFVVGEASRLLHCGVCFRRNAMVRQPCLFLFRLS